MAVRINSTLCNGCGKMKEARCVAVCPGDLLYKGANGKCSIRDPNDCWDCAACIKECPRQAIEMFLPIQIGGRGSTLTARAIGETVVWKLNRFDGKKEEFSIKVHNSMKIKND